jgi:hypothetical protein
MTMHTIDERKIVQIAKEVATANLSSESIESVASAPAIDATGREALRITIVLTPGSSEKIKGDATLNTLFQIQTNLEKAGEERFPIVEYATKEELEENAGS